MTSKPKSWILFYILTLVITITVHLYQGLDYFFILALEIGIKYITNIIMLKIYKILEQDLI